MNVVNPQQLESSLPEATWQSEKFFADNDQYFDELFVAINEARFSIILATYIFRFDSLGKRVIKRLRRAQQRGVEVRVLFDGVGSMEQGDKVAAKLEKKGIAVKIFHPLPWHFNNYHRALRRGTWIGNLVFHLLKINQRHHAKYCVIDNEVLWCGSQNISADHLSSERGGDNWHDVGARVSGPSVQAIVDAFDDLWHFRKPRLGRGLFRHYWTNISNFARREKNKFITQHLRNARERLWIINPYFSPTQSIVRALLHTARNGTDVRLIVPNKSDIEFFPLLTATYYDELLDNKVRIFEYQPAILHAKLLIMDDLSLIGSTNLNHRSLLHDVEFDVLLCSAEVRRDAQQQFIEDQRHCREIAIADLKLMGTRRLLGWIPWLLRYWL